MSVQHLPIEIPLAAGESELSVVVFSEMIPGQVTPGAHLVAILGIAALVVLAGILVIRNQFERSESLDGKGTTDAEEYLTDRERVCQLVDNNGGRMKQSAIVDSVDWSKAKVSRLLADLEEEDEITKLRLGRENLVCLRGHEPPASRSTEASKSE